MGAVFPVILTSLHANSLTYWSTELTNPIRFFARPGDIHSGQVAHHRVIFTTLTHTEALWLGRRRRERNIMLAEPVSHGEKGDAVVNMLSSVAVLWMSTWISQMDGLVGGTKVDRWASSISHGSWIELLDGL